MRWFRNDTTVPLVFKGQTVAPGDVIGLDGALVAQAQYFVGCRQMQEVLAPPPAPVKGTRVRAPAGGRHV